MKEREPDVFEDNADSVDNRPREVVSPNREIDEPPEGRTEQYEELQKDKRELFKWVKNFNFIKFIIFLMCLIYVIDLLCTKGNSSLKEPLFDVLEKILFIVAGYVFGKNGEK